MTDIKACNTGQFPNKKCILGKVCDNSGNCSNFYPDKTVVYEYSTCCYMPEWAYTGNDVKGGEWLENRCGQSMHLTGEKHKFHNLGKTYVSCSPNTEKFSTNTEQFSPNTEQLLEGRRVS
jgi:hypothetical protein